MPLRVVLVEDNPDDADLLRHLLAESRGEPVVVMVAETLGAGVAYLDRAPVDLLLLDLSLPDSCGLETVTRAFARAPRVPIIVLTGLDDDALGVQAIQAGAQDYLAKGQIDGTLLRRSIHYAIERHRLLAERTDDAQVFAALARVGEALMAGPHGNAVLERLCRVTAEVLGCDVTSTWVLDEAADAYAPVAANRHEELERIGALRVPRAALEPLSEASGPDRSVLRLHDALRRTLPEALVRLPDGVVADLCLTLRRGGRMIGTQVCGYRPEARDWTGVRDRIAHGLVHLAALALDNAQLVAELERSNAIKTYFAATMSHELRNTVFAIGGFSDMLVAALQRVAEPDPMRLARSIGERARESLQLIQAALEMTRSEVRPTQPDERSVALADVVEPLRRELEVLCNGRAVALEWDLAPELPPLQTDAVKLRMVLKNLIGNALKFTARGGIRVKADRSGDRLRLSVSDTGIGIPRDELPHIFEPFRQGRGGLSRRADGAGLGLYIVHRLVDLLGGTIAVDSTAGQGTTFSIELPLPPA
jgi:signal transduction histidine kinase/FixJ family two-component response regulator